MRSMHTALSNPCMQALRYVTLTGICKSMQHALN